jgi:hypothetical protein
MKIYSIHRDLEVSTSTVRFTNLSLRLEWPVFQHWPNLKSNYNFVSCLVCVKNFKKSLVVLS